MLVNNSIIVLLAKYSIIGHGSLKKPGTKKFLVVFISFFASIQISLLASREDHVVFGNA